MALSNIYSKLRGDASGQKNEDAAQVSSVRQAHATPPTATTSNSRHFQRQPLSTATPLSSHKSQQPSLLTAILYTLNHPQRDRHHPHRHPCSKTLLTYSPFSQFLTATLIMAPSMHTMVYHSMHTMVFDCLPCLRAVRAPAVKMAGRG